MRKAKGGETLLRDARRFLILPPFSFAAPGFMVIQLHLSAYNGQGGDFFDALAAGGRGAVSLLSQREKRADALGGVWADRPWGAFDRASGAPLGMAGAAGRGADFGRGRDPEKAKGGVKHGDAGDLRSRPKGAERIAEIIRSGEKTS